MGWFDTITDIPEEWERLTGSYAEKEKLDEQYKQALASGDIGQGQYALRKLGLAGEVMGEGVSGLLGVVTPDFITEPVGEYVGETIGEAMDYAGVTEWAKENPEMAADIRGLFGISEALGLRGLSRAPNAAAANTPTKIEGFYGGGKGTKYASAGLAGAKGAQTAFLSAFDPQAIAKWREHGVSQGLVDQTKAFVEATDAAPAIRAKQKAGQVLSKAEEKILQTADGGAGYQKGALAYAYLLNKQLGRETDFLNTAFAKEHVLSVGDMSRQGFDKAMWGSMEGLRELPEAAKESLWNHIHKVQGVKPTANTHVIVKNPTSQHQMMANEVFGAKGGSKAGRFLRKLRETIQPEHLENPQTMSKLLRMRRLDSPQREAWIKGTSKKLAGKKLTEKQQRLYDEAAQLISDTPPARYEPSEGRWYFTESHHSQAKELGGVNGWYSLDTKGNLDIVINDKHDMFGQDPIGGDSLITVFPPLQTNILDPKGSFGWTKEQMPKSDPMGATQRLADVYDTPPVEKGTRGGEWTKTTRQQADAILNLKGDVKVGDYMQAFENLSGFGTVFEFDQQENEEQ